VTFEKEFNCLHPIMHYLGYVVVSADVSN